MSGRLIQVTPSEPQFSQRLLNGASWLMGIKNMDATLHSFHLRSMQYNFFPNQVETGRLWKFLSCLGQDMMVLPRKYEGEKQNKRESSKK